LVGGRRSVRDRAGGAAVIPTDALVRLLDNIVGADRLREKPDAQRQLTGDGGLWFGCSSDLDEQDFATLARIASGEAYQVYEALDEMAAALSSWRTATVMNIETAHELMDLREENRLLRREVERLNGVEDELRAELDRVNAELEEQYEAVHEMHETFAEARDALQQAMGTP
jgi:hypothetical protein